MLTIIVLYLLADQEPLQMRLYYRQWLATKTYLFYLTVNSVNVFTQFHKFTMLTHIS